MYEPLRDEKGMKTLPETNSSHLKIGLSKRKVIFQPSIFRCKLLVQGGEFPSLTYMKNNDMLAIKSDERGPYTAPEIMLISHLNRIQNARFITCSLDQDFLEYRRVPLVVEFVREKRQH